MGKQLCDENLVAVRKLDVDSTWEARDRDLVAYLVGRRRRAQGGGGTGQKRGWVVVVCVYKGRGGEKGTKLQSV